MSDTIPRHPVARPGDRPCSQPLSRAGGLRLDQAERFLLSLGNETQPAGCPHTAYRLGMCKNHLADMIELLRAVTS